MPLPAPAMDGDRHGKQLQDIDMIRAEGGGGGATPRKTIADRTPRQAPRRSRQ